MQRAWLAQGLSDNWIPSLCVTHDVACAFIFILSCAHDHSIFVFPIPQPPPHITLRCRSTNTATIHKIKCVVVWLKLPLPQVVSPTWSTTSTTERLMQRSSRMIPSTQTRNPRTRSMRNSTMSPSEKRYLHNSSLRSKHNQRTWETYHSHEESCYQLSPFSPEQERWDQYTNQAKNCRKSLVEDRGTFKMKIYWRLWRSNFILPGLECQVYILGDNDVKYPDAEIDDEHTRNSLSSPLYLQEREASVTSLQVYHSQRESLFQRAQSIFSKHGETGILNVTKRKSNQWKNKGTLSRRSKIRDPERRIQSRSCQK